MAASVSDASWLSPMFADAVKFGTLLSELEDMVRGGLEGKDEGSEGRGEAPAVVQVVGLDAHGEQFTDMLGSALADRLKAGYLPLKPRSLGQSGDPGTSSSSSSSSSSSVLRECVNVDVEGPEGGEPGTVTEVAVDASLVKGGGVLLCSAWVEDGLLLEAAAALLKRAGGEVLGCVCIRFEANDRTQAFAAAHKVFARSRGGGRPPVLRTPPPSGCGKAQQQQQSAGGRGGAKAGGAGPTSASKVTPKAEGRRTPKTAGPSGKPPSARAAPASSASASVSPPPPLRPPKRLRSSDSNASSHNHDGGDLDTTSTSSSTSTPPGLLASRQTAAATPTGRPSRLSVSSSTFVYEANDPTEDRHAVRSVEDQGLHLFCVLDGHGSAKASEYVAQALVPEVLKRLTEAERRQPAPSPTQQAASEDSVVAWQESVKMALREAFLCVDEAFLDTLDCRATMEEAKGQWNAGCCAVLALLHGTTLFVAHTGDCRAVLGRRPQNNGNTNNSNQQQQQQQQQQQGASPVSEESPDLLQLDHASPPAPAPALQRRSPRKSALLQRLPPPAIAATALTADHNCANAAEVRLVRERCKDKWAIRVSARDAGSSGSGNGKGSVAAIERVAGSLAVTRAIGDAYLKRASLSFEPFKSFVPYITAEPEVCVLEVEPGVDRFLILATDGLWERLTNQEAAAIVESYATHGADGVGRLMDSPPHTPPSSASEALVEGVLSRVAKQQSISVRALKSIPRGLSRRMRHDDMCATVIMFQAEA